RILSLSSNKTLENIKRFGKEFDPTVNFSAQRIRRMLSPVSKKPALWQVVNLMAITNFVTVARDLFFLLIMLSACRLFPVKNWRIADGFGGMPGPKRFCVWHHLMSRKC